MTMTYAPVVILHKTSLLQKLGDFARHGYVYWTGGTVPVDKAQRLATKFADFYAINLSKDKRYRRKQEGRGNAQFLMWREDESADITWFLLVTAGDHPAHSHEKLQDLRRARITVTGYELVQQARRGQATPAWTWRMTEATYGGWRRRVIEAIRRHADMDFAQAWRTLHRAPGFAPIRSQVRKIGALARAEWKRVRAGALPVQRIRVPYVSRVAHASVPLRLVIQEAMRPTSLGP